MDATVSAHQGKEDRRLGLVQPLPSEHVNILVVNRIPKEMAILQNLFPTGDDAVLDVTPDAETAIRLLENHSYDLVALDPDSTPRGFDLLNYVKDNYRWTATLIGTKNQEPTFLRAAIACRVDGLLFRPITSSNMIEQGLLLGREARARRRRQQKRVLAIGAHPDDVEIGCGGALARHFENYDVVHILTLSRGAAGGDTNLRVAEAHNAAALIGAQLQLENLSDTAIGAEAVTIAIIAAAISELQATHVYTHSNEDTHQDHRALHVATQVAARGVPNVYCYQSPSSTVHFKPNRFVDITHYINKKIELVGTYKSQLGRVASMQPDAIVSTARYWGRFAGHVLAEPLEIVRDRDSDSERPRRRTVSQRSGSGAERTLG